MFIDTHAHLTDRAFDDDRDKVISLAKENLVEGVINSGFNLPSSLEAAALAKKYDGLYASVGFYPENILELTSENKILLEKLAKEKEVVAIGEIGLQYTEDMPDKELQKKGFLWQLELAKSLNKPFVIHCRDAYGDMLKLLKENRHLLAQGGTMHCFSGSKEIAKELIKLGLYISVGGVSTFKNALSLKETLKELPLERLLLETDCPYLTPHPFRGKRNDPSFIPVIAQNLAEIRGEKLELIARKTTLNAKELFKI